MGSTYPRDHKKSRWMSHGGGLRRTHRWKREEGAMGHGMQWPWTLRAATEKQISDLQYQGTGVCLMPVIIQLKELTQA